MRTERSKAMFTNSGDECTLLLAMTRPRSPSLVRAPFALAYSLHAHLCLLGQQVEFFFALITQCAIHRGSFESTTELVKKIDCFIRTYNSKLMPPRRDAIADSTL